MRHELKTWPEYFAAIVSTEKSFEVRKADRDFSVGDTLILCEWDPVLKDFTGRRRVRRVTYILHGPGFGVESGYCVMGIKPLEV